MKKTLLKILLLCMAICSVIYVFTACGNGNNVTVTFDTQGGSKIAPITLMKGETINRPEDPIKEGYEMVGWFIDGEEWSFIGFAVTKDIVLTAKWDTVNYTIDYDLRGGINSPDNPTTYTIESELTLTPPRKDDYVFMGWDDGGTIEKGSIGTKTFTANWESYNNVLTVKKNTITGLTEYGKTLNTIVIPEKIKGESITGIGDSAFSQNDVLSDVIISSNITNIGYYAFEGCSNLETITIPNGVTNISNRAFYNCCRLVSVNIPYSVKSIGDLTFCRCSCLISINVDVDNEYYLSMDGNLYKKNGQTLIQYAIGKTATTFTIPNSVAVIGIYAFSYCDNLKTLIIPESVKKIEDYALEFCNGLEIIAIPNSVISIGSGAFYNCNKLTTLTIPNSVKSIGDMALSACSSLEYNKYDNGLYLGNEDNPFFVLVTVISKNITSCKINNNTRMIYYAAFWNCVNLNSIIIPDNIICIGDNVFWNCVELTNVIIGQNVISIGRSAFSNCISLESVTIPKSVVNIGEYAFSSCSSLTSVIFKNTTGWQISTSAMVGSVPIIVTNDTNVATYLKSTYDNYCWICK